MLFQIIESILKALQINGQTHVVNPPLGKFVPKSKRCSKPEEKNKENNKEVPNVDKNLENHVEKNLENEKNIESNIRSISELNLGNVGGKTLENLVEKNLENEDNENSIECNIINVINTVKKNVSKKHNSNKAQSIKVIQILRLKFNMMIHLMKVCQK